MTSLGTRGYTVLKDKLTPAQDKLIRDELTVAPYVAGDYGGPNNKPTPYKVFKESQTKLYLPKYYGLQMFGAPEVDKIHPGQEIACTFKGKLRHEQEAPVKAILDACHNPMRRGGILNLTCASGKCLGRDTPILMWNGTIKPVQNVVAGDLIMGDDSTPRQVLSTCQGRERLYRVVPEAWDYEPYIVNESHILSLKDRCGVVVDMHVQEFLEMNYENRMWGYRNPVEFVEIPIHEDPFDVGARGEPIPYAYMCNSRAVRLRVLDGWSHRNRDGTIEEPADIRFIRRSLGLGPYYQLDRGTKIKLHDMGDGEYYGFEIDGNRRFMLGDFTVTHNTVLAIHCICELKQKALIVVHKDFLLKQWKERIEEFASREASIASQTSECDRASRTSGDASKVRIGTIKGKVIDVEDKDIVIASLQSLAMKEYPPDLFQSFGTVVYDEVHHLGAEVFCRALAKTCFNYTIGLSATIKRKDGLTKVFVWGIGDVVFSNVKGLKEAKDHVVVKVYDYYDADARYSSEPTMYGGKVNMSRMINNVCEFPPRLEYICDILEEILDNEPERRVLIISDRRGHLEQFHKKIHERGISSSVGYYYGGLKETQLKASEGCQIILGTYGFVSEGFDVRGLDTLIMASPKSDCIQTVGRILRDKPCDRKHVPLIIDVVDNFSVFVSQAKKRRVYYKKCKYDIHDVTHGEDAEEEEEVETEPLDFKKCMLREL